MLRRKKNKTSSRRLVGIGIDVLSLARARDLLKRHGRSFLDRILSPQEKAVKLSASARHLARFFTAKEAFFKASCMPWTDMRGFAGMWIHKIKGERFEMRCKDKRLLGEGEFFKDGGNWCAKVLVWKN